MRLEGFKGQSNGRGSRIKQKREKRGKHRVSQGGTKTVFMIP